MANTICRILVAVVALGTIGAFASEQWIGDALAHFRLQFAVAGFCAFVLLARGRTRLWAAIALLSCGINMLAVEPSLRGLGARAAALPVASSQNEPLRVAFLNVFFFSEAHERVLRFVHEQQPDAMLFAEVTPEWRAALEGLKDSYPYRHFAREGAARGVLLVSRLPIRGVENVDLGPRTEAGVSALLQVGTRDLRVIGVHATWPLGPGNFAARNRQLALLAARARDADTPVLIIGDLNVGPSSQHYRKLLAAGHLRNASRGHWWQPTWPTFMPPLGIQIDHALVSEGLVVRGFTRGPRAGSDHWPIAVDLAL